MPQTTTRRNDNHGLAAPFGGFALPTSNTTYTPNQFFDVCLPHCSRGVVRLVGYMIRKTLGWCDAHGNPRHEIIPISYNELETKAGVGHSMIRQALTEAEKAGFIRCVRPGRASVRGLSPVSAAYELAWDEGGQYVKDPKAFRGFFAGDGNRTYIPNQFFDHILPDEPLATIQVVGAVIRFSIGFVNKFGHRRQRVALSYKYIQRYAKIVSPSVLSATIRKAIARNYIERVEDGYFDPNGGVLSRCAHYGLKWAQSSPPFPITPKSVAENSRPKMHSENPSGSAPKIEAADPSEKRSGLQITRTNNISKQQTEAAATLERLKSIGFDERAAEALASRHSRERVERQIAWLEQRKATSNRLGMLRRAIEQDWAKPAVQKLGAPNFSETRGQDFGQAMANLRRRLLDRSSSITPTST